MRERSDATYHPATFQAPNLKDKKAFSFPLNYTGEPAPLIKEAREKQRPEDASGRKDNANKKKFPKQVMRMLVAALGMKMELIVWIISSRNGGASTTNHPAKDTKEKTDKKGRDSAGKKKCSRFGGALSNLRSKKFEERGGSVHNGGNEVEIEKNGDFQYRAKIIAEVGSSSGRFSARVD
ncbi:uncharacterized protein Bfra_008173 [Botrytis fragariae]|uniref:Uncharacterized protein n=1 Tax=Botrytis fragariae TaxID=1964551 RepID=A0A8H6EHZ4_9HELO|nr:uncharacterized protein Bfra_008173 [Botrytis fragariae]KAF5872896.1 hypothetical protein Bfra_008173 [Botrytis fragariae]